VPRPAQSPAQRNNFRFIKLLTEQPWQCY
jgi:hypothetical protein